MLITARKTYRILTPFVEVNEKFGVNNQKSYPDKIYETVLSYLDEAKITKGHSYNSARGGLMSFKRLVPTECVICKEVHHNDNTLMIMITPDTEAKDGKTNCIITEYCRQVKGRYRTVGTIAINLTAEYIESAGLKNDINGKPTTRVKRPVAPTSTKKPSELTKIISDIAEGACNPHDSMVSDFENLPSSQKHIYMEPTMKDYEHVHTLAILAQMKMGKTKALKRYMETYFPPASLETKVIRFITFRQTFSNSISKDFPDFTVYSDIKGDIDTLKHPRVIIQVESLHRIIVNNRYAAEPIDLLVLDEVESVLGQFNSGLHKHFNAAFAVFQWMVMTAKHLVCMDANLSDRTYQMLKTLRPLYQIYFHWNRFARASGDNYHFTKHHDSWLKRLSDELKSGRKIVLPTNSLSAAKSYEKYVKEEFPHKKVMLYSSETTVTDKATHFGDVHTYWGDLDVLIFSPTCSAGVSFELKHFDTLFAYFSDVSCDVETCRQMLARVRNIGTSNHYICFKSIGAELPTTTKDIRTQLYNKRNGLYREANGNALSFRYEPDGNIKFYESDYFGIWLETERITNLSKNRFVKRFVEQVADTGASIYLMENGSPEESKAIHSIHQDIKQKIKTEKYDTVVAAEDITEEEANSIRLAMTSGNQDIEQPKRVAYDKYQLREAYSWHGKEIDIDFIWKYYDYNVRAVYKNLLRITEGKTIEESLELIRRKEVLRYERTMENRVGESRDLILDKKLYIYQSHKIAVWLIQMCGFRCVFDNTDIPIATLEGNLRREITTLIAAVDNIVFEFAIRKPPFARINNEVDSIKFTSGMLKVINPITRKMYGVHVKRSVKKSNDAAYCLQFNSVGKLFIFDDKTQPPESVPFVRKIQ